MFLRAGFHKRFKTVCVARVRRAGRRWERTAYLLRFLPSNDYAWCSRFGCSWPEHIEIVSLIYFPPGLAARLPRSALPD